MMLMLLFVLVRIFELRKFVIRILLDSLGQSNELYMHVSKPPKDNQAVSFV